MKEVGWSKVKLMNAKDMQECLKVTSDGQIVFYIVINPQQLMRDRIEGLCGIIDSSRGF